MDLLPSDRKRNSILFLTHSLVRGGAQRQLVLLAKGLVQRGEDVTVVVFYGGNVYEDELIRAGVRVISLEKRGRWDFVGFLLRLMRLLLSERPKILHSYLGAPNVLAVLFKPLVPGIRVIWGVRASDMDFSKYDWTFRLTFWLEQQLSRFADLIIANSSAGRDHAIVHGFPKDKMRVIPNGIDTERFRFDRQGREDLRNKWRLGPDHVLVGLVARLDPMKGHEAFLRAAAMVAGNHPNVRFVAVGDGPDHYSAELKVQAEAFGLSGRMIWAGARDDMVAVYSAFDIACSASVFGEGFSNAIAEAMSCERPCVVTDVGDSSLIVGDAGVVVMPGDPQSLADGLSKLINLSPPLRGVLGSAARSRVEREFSVDTFLSRTEEVLRFSAGA